MLPKAGQGKRGVLPRQLLKWTVPVRLYEWQRVHLHRNQEGYLSISNLAFAPLAV